MGAAPHLEFVPKAANPLCAPTTATDESVTLDVPLPLRELLCPMKARCDRKSCDGSRQMRACLKTFCSQNIGCAKQVADLMALKLKQPQLSRPD